jgi:hypothetical protein
LRHRHHAAASHALQDAEQEQQIEIPRLRAEEGAYAEEPKADQEEGLAAEPAWRETGSRSG